MVDKGIKVIDMVIDYKLLILIFVMGYYYVLNWWDLMLESKVFF